MGKKTNVNKQAVDQPSKKVVEPEKPSPSVGETSEGPGEKGTSPLDFSYGTVFKNARVANRAEYQKKIRERRAQKNSLYRGFDFGKEDVQ